MENDTLTPPAETTATEQGHQAEHVYDRDERQSLYKTILGRRDVRGQFLLDPIPDAVLSRVLQAAHHAPSVGFMQPWSFLLVSDPAVKQRVHDDFLAAHNEAAEMFEGEARETYRSLKLEGILESPLNICITCDRDRAGPVVVGRTSIKSMDLYSSVCAVQNLWLAARAEGLGVGWVSIVHQPVLSEILGLPDRVVPIAYLCIGYVSHFYAQPELESAGWRPRLPLEELIRFDHWDGCDPGERASLLEQIERDQGRIREGRFPDLKE